MNSLVKVFSNFKEFYSEINGATLTGAIDVVAVEQPDGSFQCSPFHVRFGKLGVLRSREKVVDIEVNGEPVDIHMKLGDSGEAFFVEECSENDEEIPANLATSPIPTEFKFEENANFSNASEDIQLPLPMPRRNSIDLSKECCDETSDKKYENQISEYAKRRHTDTTMIRPDIAATKKEYTTQKIRQEWAEHEETIFPDGLETEENWKPIPEDENKVFRPIASEATTVDSSINKTDAEKSNDLKTAIDDKPNKEESKSKKKRRKKSVLKKKNIQRKNSTSSSAGSVNSEQQQDQDTESMTVSNNTIAGSSTDESPTLEEVTDSSSKQTPEEKTILTGSKSSDPISTQNRLRELDIHFFSDTEVAGKSPSSRPSSPIQSDTEFEVSQREKNADVMTNSASWKWGELPTKGDEIKEGTTDESKQAQRNSMLSGMFSFMKQTKKMRKSVPEGVYLSDLDAEGMDPEVAALYFPPIPSNNTSLNISQHQHEDDRESGNGTSLPQSPSSMEGAKSSDSDDEVKSSGLDFVAMSLCGGLETGGPTNEEFNQHLIKYSEVCENPAIFSLPNLVVRLNGKFYSWGAACPIVMTMITFQKPLPRETVDELMISKEDVPIIENLADTPTSAIETNKRWWYWRRSNLVAEKGIIKNEEETILAGTTTGEEAKLEEEKNYEISEAEKSHELSFDGNFRSNEKFKKSLRLTSEQIEALNLKSGVNEVTFSVTTAYQGTSRCKCYLFKWKHNDKVVISDIDGTITKSDVLGHILPMVGKDWAQIGVAQLFSKIEENGYKLLYLSARAIGQSRATREYLRSIRQGDVKLPDGPLFLNPTSLISAFHREVIEKKPEAFKIACLSDIRDLFPEKNPFYAGYGNRINDVWAYRAVGIPIMRIFTINTKGELKHELTQTFQSTYCSMAYIVDQLFPPLRDDQPAIEYSNFNYWRDPVADFQLELELNQLNASQAKEVNKSLPTIPEI